MKDKMIRVKNDQKKLQDLIKEYSRIRNEDLLRYYGEILNMTKEELAKWLAEEVKKANTYYWYFGPSRQELKDLDSFTYNFYKWNNEEKNLELLHTESVFLAMKRMVKKYTENPWRWGKGKELRDSSQENEAYKKYEDKREELAYLKTLDERHLHLSYSFLLGNAYSSLEPSTLKLLDEKKLTIALDYLLDKNNQTERMLWNISYRTMMEENRKTVEENKKKEEVKKYKRFEFLTGKTNKVKAVKVNRV